MSEKENKDNVTYNQYFQPGSNATVNNNPTFYVRGDYYTTSAKQTDERQNDTKAEGGNNADATSPGGKEEKVRCAISTLMQEKLIKYKYDWTWVILAMQDKKIDIHFDSDDKSLEYLRQMGAQELPNRSGVSTHMSATRINGDEWQFDDTTDRKETIRRNNIGKRFISAFIKG